MYNIIFRTLGLIFIVSHTSFGQGGNGVQNISNYGGNGGENEFFREVNGQKYFTLFKRTPLDTDKTLNFDRLKLGVEEGKEVGFEKNFKRSSMGSVVIPFAAEDYTEIVQSGDLKEAILEEAGTYGFETGTGGVTVKPTLTDIKYNYQKRKDNFNKLTINLEIKWDFEKDGKLLFSATTSGYYINISGNKKTVIEFSDAFNDAVTASLDKIFLIEDFRKAFALAE